MASPPESRPMSRRDSSARSSSKRRPRLLRAAATEPSITTSNARGNSLASSQSRRATDLLSRVAFISGSPPDSVIRSPSPLSTRTAMFDNADRRSELSSSPISQPDSFDELHHGPYSGRYFSFPSFDMYETDQHDEHKENELKSP
ncbi:hypothetical protein OQA88_6152 [Cercophora sp. LCS_1]